MTLDAWIFFGLFGAVYGLGYNNDGDLPVFRELLMKMGRQLLQEGERP